MNLIKEVEEWFDIPGDKQKGKLLIAYLNEGEKQEILQDCNETKYIVKDVNGEPVEEAVVVPNGTKLRNAIVTGRIKDWDNMFDADKKTKLECNDENKIAFSKLTDFMKMLNKMILKLDKKVEKDIKTETKNS